MQNYQCWTDKVTLPHIHCILLNFSLGRREGSFKYSYLALSHVLLLLVELVDELVLVRDLVVHAPDGVVLVGLLLQLKFREAVWRCFWRQNSK